MSEKKSPKLLEDPRYRFRRLLDEAEKAEQEVASAYDFSEEPTETIFALNSAFSGRENRNLIIRKV